LIPKYAGTQSLEFWKGRLSRTSPAMAETSGKMSVRAGAREEVAMFQMLNEGSTQPEERRIKTARVGALTIALLALGAVVYFFAFLPYATR
jgi:hypothetical protein